MGKKINTLVSVIIFMFVVIVLIFPLSCICLNIISNKGAFTALIIGAFILIYGVLMAIRAVRGSQIWSIVTFGVMVSFAIAMLLIANQLILGGNP